MPSATPGSVCRPRESFGPRCVIASVIRTSTSCGDDLARLAAKLDDAGDPAHQAVTSLSSVASAGISGAPAHVNSTQPRW